MLGRFASTEIKFLLIKVGLSTVVQRFLNLSSNQFISFGFGIFRRGFFLRKVIWCFRKWRHDLSANEKGSNDGAGA